MINFLFFLLLTHPVIELNWKITFSIKYFWKKEPLGERIQKAKDRTNDSIKKKCNVFLWLKFQLLIAWLYVPEQLTCFLMNVTFERNENVITSNHRLIWIIKFAKIGRHVFWFANQSKIRNNYKWYNPKYGDLFTQQWTHALYVCMSHRKKKLSLKYTSQYQLSKKD